MPHVCCPCVSVAQAPAEPDVDAVGPFLRLGGVARCLRKISAKRATRSAWVGLHLSGVQDALPEEEDADEQATASCNLP